MLRKHLFNIDGFKKSNPLMRTGPWAYRSPYPVENIFISLLWLIRVFSPGSWWGAAFSYKGNDGRYHARPIPTEIYLGLVFLFGIIAGLTDLFARYPKTVTLLAILFIVEIAMHHFWIMLIRPRIDKSYVQYSGLRTIILTCIAYINIVNLYSALYLNTFGNHFDPQIRPWLAWAYSTGEITGSGYSGVRADASVLLALTSGSEKLIGVLFLAFIVSLSLGKVHLPEIGDNLQDYSDTTTLANDNIKKDDI